MSTRGANRRNDSNSSPSGTLSTPVREPVSTRRDPVSQTSDTPRRVTISPARAVTVSRAVGSDPAKVQASQAAERSRLMAGMVSDFQRGGFTRDGGNNVSYNPDSGQLETADGQAVGGFIASSRLRQSTLTISSTPVRSRPAQVKKAVAVPTAKPRTKPASSPKVRVEKKAVAKSQPVAVPKSQQKARTPEEHRTANAAARAKWDAAAKLNEKPTLRCKPRPADNKKRAGGGGGGGEPRFIPWC